MLHLAQEDIDYLKPPHEANLIQHQRISIYYISV